jgi:hypothetical protein
MSTILALWNRTSIFIILNEPNHLLKDICHSVFFLRRVPLITLYAVTQSTFRNRPYSFFQIYSRLFSWPGTSFGAFRNGITYPTKTFDGWLEIDEIGVFSTQNVASGTNLSNGTALSNSKGNQLSFVTELIDYIHIRLARKRSDCTF